MTSGQRKMWDFYNMVPDAPIYKKEFDWYVLDRWITEGYLKPRDQVPNYYSYLNEVFGFDGGGCYLLHNLGWCEAAFDPAFEEKVLEDRGDYELVQDWAGRSVLYFKGRRNGFMPEYLDHPVKDWRTWEENVKWRLAPNLERRKENARIDALKAKKARERGDVIIQRMVGGYMYLRSLMGPEDILYAFYDEPELIHSCMQAWLALAEAVTTEHQKEVDFDELFMAEDICYNRGSLISPEMMREFLIPYYQQLITNVRRRNGGRKLHVAIDSDGWVGDTIDIYKEIGMDNMCPFEVASGCDVVAFSRQHPDLLMSGGIDKRIIVKGGDELRRHLDYIMPIMRKRGGYIPTCDHGVPEETLFENYMLYRSLMEEYCK